MLSLEVSVNIMKGYDVALTISCKMKMEYSDNIFDAVVYNRSIGNTNCTCKFHVHKPLHDEYESVFDLILGRDKFYISPNEQISTSCVIYVYSDPNLSDMIEKFYTEKFFCNLTIMNWVFDFITYIENLVTSKSDTISFHGASTYKGDHGILILGARNSGKTTLCEHLCSNFSHTMIDDDCTFLNKDLTIYGTGLPAKIRNPVQYSDYIVITCDGDGVRRGIKPLGCNVQNTIELKKIVFPRFNSLATVESIKEPDFHEFFNLFLINCKYHNKVNDIIPTAKKIYKNTKQYMIEYSYFSQIDSFLSEL